MIESLLLAVTRVDIAGRDAEQDQHLDLNCAWYADILLTLTQPAPATFAAG